LNRFIIAAFFVVTPLLPAPAGWSPWATRIVDFDPGAGADPAFSDPNAALGPIDGNTGEDLGYPGPVTMFNPPFDADEVVSIGDHGSITVGFDHVHPDRPGPDFIVIGTVGFIDIDFPNGEIGRAAMLFGDEGGGSGIEVSLNGMDYFSLSGTVDTFFPTQAYLDSGSTLAANPRKPLPLGLLPGDFSGLTFAQALGVYGGSAGGTPFDVSSSGLSGFQYVRISHQRENPASGFDVGLDALALVPEPACLWLWLTGLAVCRWFTGPGNQRVRKCREF